MSEPKLVVKFSPISKESPRRVPNPLQTTKKAAPAWSFGPPRDDGQLVQASPVLRSTSSKQLRASLSTVHCLQMTKNRKQVPVKARLLTNLDAASSSQFLEKVRKEAESTLSLKLADAVTAQLEGEAAEVLKLLETSRKHSEVSELSLHTAQLESAVDLIEASRHGIPQTTEVSNGESPGQLVDEVETPAIVKPRIRRRPYKGVKHVKTYWPGPGQYSPMLPRSSSGYSFKKGGRFDGSPKKGFASPGPAMYSPHPR